MHSIEEYLRRLDSPRCIRWLRIASWLCVAAILLYGGILRRSMPDVPIYDRDTWGYIRPALGWLSGLGFEQVHGRGWFFPAVLAAVFKIGGSFFTITYFQQALGLLGAFILWVALMRWLTLLAGTRGWVYLVGILCGLPAVALYALNPGFMLFERSMRPESLMIFFVICYLWSSVGFFDRRWNTPSLVPAVAYGAAAVLCSYVVLLLKPSWMLAFAISLLPLIAGIFSKGGSALRLLPPICGIVLVGIFAVMPRILEFKPDIFAPRFLPATLVCIHANFILPHIQKRMQTAPPEEAAILKNFAIDLENALTEAKKNPKPFLVLGFQADDIMYRSKTLENLLRAQKGDSKKYISFCYSAYIHAWLDSPFGMAGKVCRQLDLFLFPARGEYYNPMGKPAEIYERAILALETSPKFSPAVEAQYDAYVKALHEAAGQTNRREPPNILISLASLISHASFVLQIMFFGALLWRWKCCTASERLAGMCTLSLLFVMYGYVLTVGAAHALDIFRYRASFAAFFLPILAMLAIFSLTVILSSIFPSLRPSAARTS